MVATQLTMVIINVARIDLVITVTSGPQVPRPKKKPITRKTPAPPAIPRTAASWMRARRARRGSRPPAPPPSTARSLGIPGLLPLVPLGERTRYQRAGDQGAQPGDGRAQRAGARR